VNPGDKLTDRYEIVRELGRGGAGVTYLAKDALTGRDVVAKLLHLGLLGDWKAVELFEREAAILRDLHHERIPAYVDFFTTELDGTPRFVLVREFVDGVSLQARVQGGWRGTEDEIRDVGVRLSRIVAYIHSVRPPVIHRDINPRNIMVRGDGEVFLVDFGGVQDAIRVSTGGSFTIVGTPGYTPMEQFVGRATIRSDLYAVAATLLFLLTHRNPVDLPVKEMKVDFSSVIEISSRGLSRVLVNWLEPDEAKRTLTVEAALALLEGTVAAEAAAAEAVRAQEQGAGRPAAPSLDHPPHGSRITRTVHGGIVTLLVPDTGGARGMPVFGPLIFFWVIFGGFWRQASTTIGIPTALIVFALPFLAAGFGIFSGILRSVFGKLGIEIGVNGLAYTRQLFFFSRRRTIPLEEVGECRIEDGREMRTRSWGGGGWGSMYGYGYRSGMDNLSQQRRSHGRSSTGRLALEIGARTLRFGENLSVREREWLRDAINDELRKARGARQELQGSGA
jgi:eukaryotic-like serine/threonine-protein kinase